MHALVKIYMRSCDRMIWYRPWKPKIYLKSTCGVCMQQFGIHAEENVRWWRLFMRMRMNALVTHTHTHTDENCLSSTMYLWIYLQKTALFSCPPINRSDTHTHKHFPSTMSDIEFSNIHINVNTDKRKKKKKRDNNKNIGWA